MGKKKVAIIGTNGLPGYYGGWDQLVLHLTKYLNKDYDFIVYTSYTNYDENYPVDKSVKIKRVWLKANGWQSIPYDIFSMIHAILFCDVLFVCGTSGCLVFPIIKLFKVKVVLNPDGQEWKRGKWNSLIKYYLKLSERIGVVFADKVVSDNKVICANLIRDYRKKSVLIEYGGDHVSNVPLHLSTMEKYGIEPLSYSFKVARIVPENNIDLILETFKCRPSERLIIVGNWKVSKYGRNIYKNYSEFSNIVMLDPIYDLLVLNELRCNCKFYIHGHSVGGTNPSLVEAMCLGLCILSYDVSYNRETTENKAYYFSDIKMLLELIDRINVNDRNLVSNEMKEIARRRYTWKKITSHYSDVFG